jgi:hypothetical protein
MFSRGAETFMLAALIILILCEVKKRSDVNGSIPLKKPSPRRRWPITLHDCPHSRISEA